MRRMRPPLCPECGKPLARHVDHNGYKLSCQCGYQEEYVGAGGWADHERRLARLEAIIAAVRGALCDERSQLN